ncbi:MAG: antibiotic biosynthesis monooxygenase [Limisphaerales bacterium]
MSSKNITVVATFQAKPGKEAELKKALISLVAPTHKEAGCINYDLHVSAEDPANFFSTKIGPARRISTPI